MSPASPIKKRGRKGKSRSELEALHPWIGQLKASMREMVVYDGQELLEPMVRWLKKMESSMSLEIAKLRNKPNRATKIVALSRGLMSKFKLMASQMENEDVFKLYPTFALITQYYLNLVFKSTMRNKKRNDQIALEVYSFVKMMLHESPEYILDAILTSSAGENCPTSDSFESMVLKLVVYDKFLFDKESSSLLKYLAVVALMKECGCNIGEFREIIKRHPYIPPDFAKHVRAVAIKLKPEENFDLQRVVERMHSRPVAQRCRTRLYVISSDNLKYQVNDDCESDDTVSMLGDDDTEVSSTNPALDVSVKTSNISDSDSDEESRSHLHGSENEDNECNRDVVYDSDERDDLSVNVFRLSSTKRLDDLDSDVDNDDEQGNLMSSYSPATSSQIFMKPSKVLSPINEMSDDSDIGIIEEVLVNRDSDCSIMPFVVRAGERDEADASDAEAEKYVPQYPSPDLTNEDFDGNSDVEEDNIPCTPADLVNEAEHMEVEHEVENVISEAGSPTSNSENNSQEETPSISEGTVSSRLRRRAAGATSRKVISNGEESQQQGNSPKTPTKRDKIKSPTITTPMTRARKSLAASEGDTVAIALKGARNKSKKGTITEAKLSSRSTPINTPTSAKATPKSATKRGKRI